MEVTWSEFWGAFSLFRDPLLAAGVAGIALGLLSLFIVLRRMVFLSAALAQSAGLGVALAFYLEILLQFHISAVWGALLCAFLAGGLVSIRAERLGTTREAMLALIFIMAGGFSVMLGSQITQEAHDIHAILFGSAVLVRSADLILLMIGAALTVAFIVILWRGLLFVNFDSEAAQVQQLPKRFLNIGLFTLIIVMNAIGTRALGMLPVFAFATLPAVAALAFTRTLYKAAVLACLFGLVGGIGGYMLAFFLDLPVGAAQTVLVASFAAVGLVYKRVAG
jgi:zinc transport system permease protein